MSEWISVKDRLPEKEVPVLLIVHGGQRYTGFPDDIFIGKRHTVPPGDGKANFFGLSAPESEWDILSWSYYQKPEPVYWMPLPEAPKDGDTE